MKRIWCITISVLMLVAMMPIGTYASAFTVTTYRDNTQAVTAEYKSEKITLLNNNVTSALATVGSDLSDERDTNR